MTAVGIGLTIIEKCFRLTARGKGCSPVPIGERAVMWIEKYLDEAPERAAKVAGLTEARALAHGWAIRASGEVVAFRHLVYRSVPE